MYFFSKRNSNNTKKFIEEYIYTFKFTFLIAMFFVVFSTVVFLGIGLVLKYCINSISEGMKNGNLEFTQLYILFIFIFLFSICIFFRAYFMSKCAEQIVFKMRKDIYKRIINFPMKFFNEKNNVSLLEHISKDVPFIGNTITYDFSGMLRQILTIVGAMIMLIYNNLQLTITLFSLIACVLILSVYIGRKMKVSIRNVNSFVARLNLLFEETVYGIKVLKSFNRESLFTDMFFAESFSIYKKMKKYILLKSLFTLFIIIFIFTILTGILGIGVKGLLENNISVAELSVFVIYSIIIVAAVADLSDRFGKIQQFILTIDNIYSEVLCCEYDLHDECKDVDKYVFNRNFDKGGFQKLEFKNVSFGYVSNSDKSNANMKYILNDVSFAINKGEKIALIGISGAGKTTIFDLIMSFKKPLFGDILVNDSIHYSDLSYKEINSLFAWVPQELTIFSGCIKDNVSLFDRKYSDSDIISALEDANASNFVIGAGGISYDIGEKGAKISHGQKQRIAIARAILHDAPILLMDEVTSALDIESEEHIKKYLRSCNKTQIVIAHKLSTVISSDKILLLQDGGIVAQGTHAELLNTSSEYRKIVSMFDMNGECADI